MLWWDNGCSGWHLPNVGKLQLICVCCHWNERAEVGECRGEESNPLETRLLLLHIKFSSLAADRLNYSNYHVNIFPVKGKSQNHSAGGKCIGKQVRRCLKLGLALI